MVRSDTFTAGQFMLSGISGQVDLLYQPISSSRHDFDLRDNERV